MGTRAWAGLVALGWLAACSGERDLLPAAVAKVTQAEWDGGDQPRCVQRMDVFDLGVRGEEFHYSTFDGINDLGEVVGYAANGYAKALYWSEDTGPITEPVPPPYEEAFVDAINEAGAMTGFVTDQVPTSSQRGAVLEADGDFHLIDPLPGHDASLGADINDSGLVVGYSSRSGDGQTLAIVWDDGETRALAIPTGSIGSIANALNSDGVIVGAVRDAFFTSHAAAWIDGEVFTLDPSYGLTNNVATDINDRDQIVGWDYSGAGFLYDEGLTVLAPVPGFATSLPIALNDRTQIVGVAQSGAVQRAALWQGSQAWDMNLLIDPGSGWVLERAHDINSRGWVVGRGTIEGEEHGFLAVPNGRCVGVAVPR